MVSRRACQRHVDAAPPPRARVREPARISRVTNVAAQTAEHRAAADRDQHALLVAPVNPPTVLDLVERDATAPRPQLREPITPPPALANSPAAHRFRDPETSGYARTATSRRHRGTLQPRSALMSGVDRVLQPAGLLIARPGTNHGVSYRVVRAKLGSGALVASARPSALTTAGGSAGALRRVRSRMGMPSNRRSLNVSYNLANCLSTVSWRSTMTRW